MYSWPIESVFKVFYVKAHNKMRWCFNPIIRFQHIVKFCASVWSRFGLKTNFNLFHFSLSHTTKTWAEYNSFIHSFIHSKSIERFSSSHCTECEAIKYSENAAKAEVDFEANWGETVFGIFLPKKAVLAETNYGPFLFLLRPIFGKNTSEINYSTYASDRRFWSIFTGIHSKNLCRTSFEWKSE